MNYELQTISCIWFEILQYPACWTIHFPCILSSECRRLSGRYTVFLPAFSVFCLFLQCCRIAPAPAKVLTYAPIPGAVLYPVPDHSSYPAVLLPDRMSVCQFVCNTFFAILFLIYFIFIFVIGGATQRGTPDLSQPESKIIVPFVILIFKYQFFINSKLLSETWNPKHETSFSGKSILS